MQALACLFLSCAHFILFLFVWLLLWGKEGHPIVQLHGFHRCGNTIIGMFFFLGGNPRASFQRSPLLVMHALGCWLSPKRGIWPTSSTLTLWWFEIWQARRGGGGAFLATKIYPRHGPFRQSTFDTILNTIGGEAEW